MTVSITQPGALFTERGTFRPRVAAARALIRVATRLLPPVPLGPSPCCPHGEFLVPYPPEPGMLCCTRDGRLYQGPLP